MGFKLTTLVIGTDCIGSCKSNYHKITTTSAPQLLEPGYLLKNVCHNDPVKLDSCDLNTI